MKKLIEDNEVYLQLKNLERYKFLTQSIENVINRKLTALQQFEIIEKIEKQLTGVHSEKLRKSLEKNSKIRNFVENLKNNIKNDSTFSYAPITTVDVERSFAKFKYLVTDIRIRLTEKCIEKLNFTYVNNFL